MYFMLLAEFHDFLSPLSFLLSSMLWSFCNDACFITYLSLICEYSLTTFTLFIELKYVIISINLKQTTVSQDPIQNDLLHLLIIVPWECSRRPTCCFWVLCLYRSLAESSAEYLSTRTYWVLLWFHWTSSL